MELYSQMFARQQSKHAPTPPDDIHERATYRVVLWAICDDDSYRFWYRVYNYHLRITKVL